ncbi:protein OSB1, mitochondrial [Beta vulgaris subsp. vulgaris]|uniref:protein OSB1, mitochondrial n=1 Tax=Beta vulgaris subsp. vulgaris TaxID=3555 RepID=UPI0020372309|nr:protein OSB1, mitochondrial [Beta vulgaris subsp. vulgaris]
MATLTKTLYCKPQFMRKTLIPISCSFSFSSLPSFSLRQNIKHLVCKTETRCSLSNQDSYDSMETYTRPSEIQWKKELCNSVQLIGIVALPVQLTHLSSGKVVASTRLAVRKSATNTSWINLTLWDELAHVAHQHLEKGQQIFVSGRLISDTVDNEDGKQQTYYKVVVQQLNFVERNSSSPVALYDDNSDSTSTVGKFVKAPAINKLSTQELWQAYFANPTDWWDNRKNKKNLKSPDFKHKDTGEALWVESRYNPPWVKSQLEILDSRMMQSFQKQEGPSFSDYFNGGY